MRISIKNLYYSLPIISITIIAIIYFLYIIIPDLYSETFFVKKLITHIDKFYDDNNSKNSFTFTLLKIQTIIYEKETGIFKIKRHGKNLIVKRSVIDGNYEEKNILKKTNHPNIVKIFKIFTTMHKDLQISWIFMENLEIIVNFPYIKQNPSEIQVILKDVIKGLEYLHNNNIAHLDIKMENIMGKIVGGKVMYKIIDFGYSKVIKDSVFYEGKGYGTFPYKPPEVFFKNLHTKKADMWCLGVMAYFLVKGEYVYFVKDQNASISDYIDFIREIENSVKKMEDIAIMNIIQRCVILDHTKREDVTTLLAYLYIYNDFL